jgi:hypothetical protein
MQVWLVFKYICGDYPTASSEFLGIFDSEEKAVARCTIPQHWVGPANLNEALPDEPTPWPGAYYPIETPAENE